MVLNDADADDHTGSVCEDCQQHSPFQKRKSVFHMVLSDCHEHHARIPYEEIKGSHRFPRRSS